MRAPPTRFWIGLMIFFSAATNYMMRANMSVSVPEMAKLQNASGNNSVNVCPPVKLMNYQPPKGGSFDWNQNIQGQLLAAYFYGTMVSFAIGGTAAEILGAVNVIIVTSAITAVLAAINPIVSTACPHWGCTFSVRFLTGVLGGPVYPAMNVLIAHWAPPAERGKFVSALIGNTIGVVITWLMVGFCTAHWGWESGFYSVAVTMVLYCVIFYAVTTDYPKDHRCISEEEKNYITESLAQTLSASKNKGAPPYGKIFKSRCFWAVVVAQFGNLWGLNLNLTFTPKYFKEVLNFNLKGAVSLAVIPYIARLVFSQIFGVFGDFLKKKEVFKPINIRRLFVVISHFVPALCFGSIYFCNCNWGGVLALLTINQALTGAVVAGHLVNTVELSPNFAGTLYGIMNWIASSTGFIIPIINGAIMNSMLENPILAASIIYILGSFIMILCGIFFIIFLSVDVQPWNWNQPEGQEPAPSKAD